MNLTTTPSELLEYAVLLSKLNANQMLGVKAVIDSMVSDVNDDGRG
jgi:hypothetical protein